MFVVLYSKELTCNMHPYGIHTEGGGQKLLGARDAIYLHQCVCWQMHLMTSVFIMIMH